MKAWLIFILWLTLLGAQESRLFTDINDQPLMLPPTLERVYGSAPPITALLYVIDETTLVGVNLPVENKDNTLGGRFLSERFRNLPLLGGWHGNRTPNLEGILKAAPQLIVTWDTPLLRQKALQDIDRLGIPAIKVNIDSTRFYPEVFRYLGAVLNKPERAESLAQLSERFLSELDQFVQGITPERRAKVYYAQGDSGLFTECDQSFHSEPLALAGGNLVHHCTQNSVMGMQEVSFEQVLAYAPEVIITQSPTFYKSIFSDTRWQILEAVKQKRVFLVPRSPLNWLDRPPSFMRILGAHWVASRLYPKHYPYDIRTKTREFYQLFFGVKLSEEELVAFFDP